MTEQGSQAAGWAALALIYAWSVVGQLHPGAAAGASFGCFFFLAFPDPSAGRWWETLTRKFALLVFSWGAGYAVGDGIATSSEWAGWAKAAAVAVSAIAATVMGALNLMVRNDGPLPRWLGAIVDRVPLLRGSRND